MDPKIYLHVHTSKHTHVLSDNFYVYSAFLYFLDVPAVKEMLIAIEHDLQKSLDIETPVSLFIFIPCFI